MLRRLVTAWLLICWSCAPVVGRGRFCETESGGAHARPEKHAPHWIWAEGSSESGVEVWFTKEFSLAGPARGMCLETAADNVLELFLDGKPLAVSDDWARPVRMEHGANDPLTRRFDGGPHVLSARCANKGGPAGFWLDLELTLDPPLRLTSDSSWHVARGEPAGWRDGAPRFESRSVPVDLGPLGVEPWGTPTAWSSGVPARPIDPAQVEVAPGFRVELVHAVPRHRQGSWVSLAFDDRGRLFSSDQYGGLWRLTPGDGSGPAVVDQVPVALGEAHGLAFVGDTLFAVVSGAGTYASGLYRVTDSDADDTLDRVELLASFDGTGEHGPHAVVPDRDGDGLWILAGNHTVLPDFITESRVPRLWAEDQLLPSMDDPNGHAVGRRAPAGWLAHCDLDGENWILQACGLRNAFDLVETADGDLLSFDADMEWDVGLPWYRPSRVLHLVSGADFGWRSGSGKWPTHYLDTLPALVNMGLTSPTGLALGAKTDFPAAWRDRLFLGDWAYGTIFAVDLEPQGASFGGRAQVFVRGLPLPVTDLVVGPDGALWFAVGGRRAQSGVYRVFWDAAQTTAIPEASESPGLHVAGGSASTALRRRLEAWHGPGLPAAIDGAWPYLGHEDRFIQHAARTAIEHQDPALWRERALSESDPRAAAQALAALARSGQVEPEPFYGALGAWDLTGLAPALQLDFLRVWELGFLRLGWPRDDVRSMPSAAWLDTALPGVPVEDMAIAIQLLKLAVFGSNQGAVDVELVPRLVRMLEGANTQEESLALLNLLRHLRDGWSDEWIARAWRCLDARAPAWSGGHSVELYAERMREDLGRVAPRSFDVLIDDAVAADRFGRAAIPTNDPPPAPFVRAWTLEELSTLLAQDPSGGDGEAGRRAFRKASCVVCHRFGGEGGSRGPDLTGVAARFGSSDLLRTILLPSETVSDQYQDEEVWTKDGKLFLGRAAQQADGSLVVHLTGEPSQSVRVASQDVDLRRPHPLSPMPSGLLDVLSAQEILDLIAFLRGD